MRAKLFPPLTASVERTSDQDRTQLHMADSTLAHEPGMNGVGIGDVPAFSVAASRGFQSRVAFKQSRV
jgi:hypothetical protein